ncbi:MAG: 50S ribosomal protein L30 [Spirochaetaceae bacterium]|jgi:large subunit ribosomal protein L30|nr:50S ribosomal protein L30 [Spirochaetaceae bacterium]
MADVSNGKVRIRLVRSTIGVLPNQRATIRSLGLRKIGSVVEQEVNGAIMGMVKTVSHLVEVEKIG